MHLVVILSENTFSCCIDKSYIKEVVRLDLLKIEKRVRNL